jgi:hypothetical protein
VSEEGQAQQVKMIRVPCRACGGKGAQTTRGNGPELVAHKICQACGGQREIQVRDIDPAFSIVLEGLGPDKSKKKTLIAVTWAGDVMSGSPFTKEEHVIAATVNDASGGLVSAVMLLASEVVRLRSRLREVEGRLNIHAED